MKLIDYLSGGRRGREAHDLELEAQRDPLLAEALQGLEETPGDHREALASLRRRIVTRAALETRRRHRRLVWRVVGMAAALLVAVTTAVVTLHRAGEPEGAEIARGPELPEFPAIPASPSGERAESPAESPAKAPEKPERPAISLTSAVPSKVPPQDGIADPAEQPCGDEDTAPAHPVEGKDEEKSSAPATVPSEQPVIRGYGAVQKAEYAGSTSEKQGPDSPPAAENLRKSLPAGGDFTEFHEDVEPVLTAPVPTEKEVEEETPFLCAETLPRFQGQDYHSFRKWVQERVRHPKIALSHGVPGRVVVSFVIDTTGRLTQIQVLQNPDRSLTDEVVRVLKQSPRWEPGRQGDRKVPVKICIPVDFRSQIGATGTTGKE